MSMTITDEFDNADPATILDQLTDFVTASVEEATRFRASLCGGKVDDFHRAAARRTGVFRK